MQVFNFIYVAAKRIIGRDKIFYTGKTIAIKIFPLFNVIVNRVPNAEKSVKNIVVIVKRDARSVCSEIIAFVFVKRDIIRIFG